MASIDPSWISEKKKWVDEISIILNHQLNMEVETPCVSIFRVPESITTQKPQAYERQKIGLGPFHHFRPRLYEKMEHKKLAAMRRVLKNHNIKDFELIVLYKVRKLVPLVRECYDMFLQDDTDSLAWVFAMDGLFLLDLLGSNNYQLPSKKKASEKDMDSDDLSNPRNGDQIVDLVVGHETERLVTSKGEIIGDNQIEIVVSDDSASLSELEYTEDEECSICSIPFEPPEVSERRLLAQDIMMLENQIPFMTLKEINQALHSSSGDSSDSQNDFSPSIFRSFAEIHSPLELCLPSLAPPHVDHLLQYVYHSIVNNVPVHKEPMCGMAFSDAVFGFLGFFKFIKKIPQDAIVQIYEQTVTVLETFSQSKTIIASAFKLHKRAGFRFRRFSYFNEGIQNIHVDIEDNIIYLPRVRLNKDSEVILRNLVAYETSIVNNILPLTEFVALMCALIVNVNDVKLLQKAYIIEGGLEVDEVVKLFTSITSSIPSFTKKEKSELQKSIEQVNSVYESTLTMQIVFFLKKIANGLLVVLRAIGGFVEASWKSVASVAGIVAVSILIWQAYCDVYGCDKTKDTLTFAPR